MQAATDRGNGEAAVISIETFLERYTIATEGSGTLILPRPKEGEALNKHGAVAFMQCGSTEVERGGIKKRVWHTHLIWQSVAKGGERPTLVPETVTRRDGEVEMCKWLAARIEK